MVEGGRATAPALVPHRYFTQDQIANLKIKVTLKKSRHQTDAQASHRDTHKAALLRAKRERMMASPPPVKPTTTTTSQQALPSLATATPGMALPALKEVVLEKTLAWQEKVYTAREILTCCHSRNVPKAHHDRAYLDNIRTFLKAAYKTDDIEAASRTHILQQSGVLLATKVDADDYIHPSMLEENVTSSSNRRLNALAMNAAMGSGSCRRDPRSVKMTVVSCVDLPDNDNELKHWAKVQRVGYEHVLYQVRLFDNGTFDIRPQFSAGGPADAPPHVFRSPAGVWYEYWVEDVSERGAVAPTTTTAPIRRPLTATPIARLTNRPAPGYLVLNLFGEICQTRDVDADNVWVQYQVDMPEGWQWSKHDRTRRNASLTQMATSVVDDERRRVCRFAFPFELELVGRLDHPVVPMPTIYFQVSSTDCWDRDRVEGYTFVQVPASAGCHEISSPLWRPVGTLTDQCYRYFLGGAPTLSSIFLGGLPPDNREHGAFSRYGFATVESGYLDVRINAVITICKDQLAAATNVQQERPPLRITGGAIDHVLEKEQTIMRAIQALRLSVSPPDQPAVPPPPASTDRRSTVRRRTIGTSRRVTLRE
ncbi:Meckel syndrome type 1 protein [Plasmodiophora brassicae]